MPMTGSMEMTGWMLMGTSYLYSPFFVVLHTDCAKGMYVCQALDLLQQVRMIDDSCTWTTEKENSPQISAISGGWGTIP